MQLTTKVVTGIFGSLLVGLWGLALLRPGGLPLHDPGPSPPDDGVQYSFWSLEQEVSGALRRIRTWLPDSAPPHLRQIGLTNYDTEGGLVVSFSHPSVNTMLLHVETSDQLPPCSWFDEPPRARCLRRSEAADRPFLVYMTDKMGLADSAEVADIVDFWETAEMVEWDTTPDWTQTAD